MKAETIEEKIAIAKKQRDLIRDDISKLQENERRIENRLLELEREQLGLVEGETVLRELKRTGGRVGRFVGMYKRFGSSGWVRVQLRKKNGEFGKREVTFYDWVKAE